MTAKVTDLSTCDISIFRTGIQHIVCAKKINERKTKIFRIIWRFSRKQQIQKIKVLKRYAEKRQKYILN